MAITLNTNIKNDTGGYLLDAKNVKGGYLSVDTLANLQSFSLSTKEAGSFVYVRENSKFYIYDGTSWQETKFYDDTEIKNIIPADANVNNKLADKNYVSERMAQISSGTAMLSYDMIFALFAQYIYDKIVENSAADGTDLSDDTIIRRIKQSIFIVISDINSEDSGVIITLEEALANANLDIDHILSLINYNYIDNKIKEVKGSFLCKIGSAWNYINDGDIDIAEMFTKHGITDLEPLSPIFKLKSANVGDNIYIVSQGVPDLWLAIKASGGLGFVSLDSSIDLSNIESSMSSINTEINSVKSALDLKADKKDVSEVDINLEGTSTTVSIPENITGYGSIVELSGKSYKSENLIVLNDVAETTTNGITYSIKNGIITLNGTASDNIIISLIPSISLNGTYYSYTFGRTDNVYLMFYKVDDGNYYYTNTSFVSNNNSWFVRLDIKQGSTFSNYNVSPMLVKGTTAPTEFKQGFEGIKIEYPTSVKVVGANLLNITDVSETTIDGITYSITNGELKMKGTTTKNYWTAYIPLGSDLEIGQYLFSSYGSGTYSSTTLYFKDVNSGNDYVDYAYPSSTDRQLNFSNTIKYIKIYIHNIGTSVDFSSKLLLTKNATAPTTFKPYIEQNLSQTNIINYVSNELQTNHSWTSENASKWLGLGVSDSNIIDYVNKKAIIKYSIVDLGTLNWAYRSSDGLFGADLSDSKIYSNDIVANAICSRFEIVSRNNMVDKTFSINNEKSLCAFNTSYTNATDFKTAMSGIMLIYELATPIEIDISEIESEAHFECESNGTIIHDSITNYKYSFPVSLKGQVELNFEHDIEQQRDIDNLYRQMNSINENIGNISNMLDEINGEVI